LSDIKDSYVRIRRLCALRLPGQPLPVSLLVDVLSLTMVLNNVRLVRD